MIKKSVVRLAIVGMLLFGVAQAVYGYWTDQIAVREEVALVWPVEIEIETQEESEVEESETEEAKGNESEMERSEIEESETETGQENLQEGMEQDV